MGPFSELTKNYNSPIPRLSLMLNYKTQKSLITRQKFPIFERLYLLYLKCCNCYISKIVFAASEMLNLQYLQILVYYQLVFQLQPSKYREKMETVSFKQFCFFAKKLSANIRFDNFKLLISSDQININI